MRTRSLRALAVMAYVVALANASPQASKASFQVVTYMNSYGQPGGIVEGSPGTFLFEAGSATMGVLSVTTQGVKTVIANFPSGYNIQSGIVSGPNGRLYSAVELSDNPTTVFSVTASLGANRYTQLRRSIRHSPKICRGAVCWGSALS